MARTCFHCDGSGHEDVETGDPCREDDENAGTCHVCHGSGEVEPTADEEAEAEGDRQFHIKHDEGEI